ncbi:hypothetical protein ACFX43_02095 [Nocardioides sp. YIM B13467]|uniref:hypothetical protein n=1 Tax=Nocardioides sp. YIM B13467 TaxID=3366294 RepID=UPI0036701F4F
MAYAAKSVPMTLAQGLVKQEDKPGDAAETSMLVKACGMLYQRTAALRGSGLGGASR